MFIVIFGMISVRKLNLDLTCASNISGSPRSYDQNGAQTRRFSLSHPSVSTLALRPYARPSARPPLRRAAWLDIDL